MSLEFKAMNQESNINAWKRLIETTDKFSKIFRLLEILYTLPFSTAEIERAFSSLNLIKTPMRSTLGDNMTTVLVTIKESLKRKRIFLKAWSKKTLRKSKTLCL